MDNTVELKLIVPLGNPGREYALTRHNTGWRVAELLLQRSAPAAKKCEWQSGNGELYRFYIGGKELLMLFPTTYMNLSGEAVILVTEHFGISPHEMLVISDDLDLPVGQMRLRAAGSPGGHRGIASISQHLQTREFPRLRVGIGRPEPDSGVSIVDYVLAPWVSALSSEPPEPIVQAAEIVQFMVTGGTFEQSAQRAGQCGKSGQVQCQQVHQEKEKCPSMK